MTRTFLTSTKFLPEASTPLDMYAWALGASCPVIERLTEVVKALFLSHFVVGKSLKGELLDGAQYTERLRRVIEESVLGQHWRKFVSGLARCLETAIVVCAKYGDKYKKIQYEL